MYLRNFECAIHKKGQNNKICFYLHTNKNKGVKYIYLVTVAELFILEKIKPNDQLFIFWSDEWKKAICREWNRGLWVKRKATLSNRFWGVISVVQYVNNRIIIIIVEYQKKLYRTSIKKVKTKYILKKICKVLQSDEMAFCLVMSVSRGRNIRVAQQRAPEGGLSGGGSAGLGRLWSYIPVG